MYVYCTSPVASTGSLRAAQAGPRGWRRSRLGGRPGPDCPGCPRAAARATFFGILRSGSHLRPLQLSGRNQLLLRVGPHLEPLSNSAAARTGAADSPPGMRRALAMESGGAMLARLRFSHAASARPTPLERFCECPRR